MNNFLNVNRSLLTYSLIILVIIPFFKINFLLTFLGNILLLLFLIPIFLLLLVFIGFNSYKSKTKICSNCGSIFIGLSETCMMCGSELDDSNKRTELIQKPSQNTIDIKAEEIK